MAQRFLGFHKPRKEMTHLIVIIHLPNPTHILIWSHNHTGSTLGIDPVILVRLSVTFVVGLIINKYLPVIPSLGFVERMEDFREIVEFDFCSGAGMDGEDLDHAVDMLVCGGESMEEGFLAAELVA